MSYGEHLSTLIGVIVGLAITELLSGASRTLRCRGAPGFSWLPFMQAVMIATITLIFWLASYAELATGKYLNVTTYVTQLIAPGLLYFAATRVFPPIDGETGLTALAHPGGAVAQTYRRA